MVQNVCEESATRWKMVVASPEAEKPFGKMRPSGIWQTPRRRPTLDAAADTTSR
jgi:hypothetical protein